MGFPILVRWYLYIESGPSILIVYSTVCSGKDQRKHQSSASLAFVRGIHWWPVNSLHKGSATWKMFPFDDVILLRMVLNVITQQIPSPVIDLAMWILLNPCQWVCHTTLINNCYAAMKLPFSIKFHVMIWKFDALSILTPEIQNYWLPHGSVWSMGHDPYGSQSTGNGSHHWYFYTLENLGWVPRTQVVRSWWVPFEIEWVYDAGHSNFRISVMQCHILYWFAMEYRVWVVHDKSKVHQHQCIICCALAWKFTILIKNWCLIYIPVGTYRSTHW